MIVTLRSVHIARLVFIAECAALAAAMVMVDRQVAAFSLSMVATARAICNKNHSGHFLWLPD